MPAVAGSGENGVGQRAGQELDLRSEAELAVVARALAGGSLPRMAPERLAAAAAAAVPMVRAGHDPLGECFSRLRSPVVRRERGAVYTPTPIIESMLRWAASVDSAPARIVDPGSGSGRFILTAARMFPHAALVAIETDPLAILMLRANAAVLGIADRLTLYEKDYRKTCLPQIAGRTLYLGNPPYVRHHAIGPRSKAWFTKTAAALGIRASALAGLHIHFFLRTRELAQPGDYGAFVTAAEWLDVNYGAALRSMLANGLGGTALHVLTPESMPFAGTATTGAITCFTVGTCPDTIRLRSVQSLDELGALADGQNVEWTTLERARRWSPFFRSMRPAPAHYIELGELCRVHRGQVTGGNNVWIAGAYDGALPASVLVPAITKARELLAAGPWLTTTDRLRRVIDLPSDLDTLSHKDRVLVERFLAWARRHGAHTSYIARARRRWWAVGMKPPAAILCTYMARQAPAFVLNVAGARHINIAHGLYPREPMTMDRLSRLARFLRENVSTAAGRTYAGGLTKFEPKEVERLLVPPPDEL